MKKNNGKNFEKLIRIIEEVYKTNPETVIHSNYKIQNTSGNKRELDIFIETSVNGHHLKIAIECKDYQKRVSALVVESFHSKCLRIPEINKKIIVSKNGFQKEAFAAAKDFGIDLYNFEEVEKNSDEIFFIPMKRFAPTFIGYTIESLDCSTNFTDENFEEKVILKKLDFEIFSVDSQIVYNINDIINEGLRTIWSTFGYAAFFNWIKNKEECQSEPFVVACEGVYFLDEEKKIFLNQIKGFVNFKCEGVLIETDKKVLLNSTNKQVKAHTQTFNDDKKKIKGSVVVDSDNNMHFFDSSKEHPVKLQVIAKYDPNTDKMDFF